MGHPQEPTLTDVMATLADVMAKLEEHDQRFEQVDARLDAMDSNIVSLAKSVGTVLSNQERAAVLLAEVAAHIGAIPVSKA